MQEIFVFNQNLNLPLKTSNLNLVSITIHIFGTEITTKEPYLYLVQQSHYISSLKESPNNAEIESFRRTRALMAWILHCRPEYTCIFNNSAQVTKNNF